ncbi:Rap guanine nucleotide exchange factor 1 [Elysia marginata]|uniref:CRK SH3-binding GNRP n=1 Tax=Elysia marginata TaxID=1093978 RepID=A0AAV4F8G9_9GAST|nr:Rap guanine nucleotide exchange factor 1 [Elysia marginata]
MTLLDSQLFQKIEIPEVLLWPSEQSEELSPHLTMFTEHFNKMSYWCRTRILTQDDPRDREKYHIKFIKIMRHLKELHNFNSYLAILSAVDSAPVRRLEWPEKNLEILHKLGQLIDSRSSFKAYRQALAETDPPCIPYLGLILQDLTFVNYGNPDKLADGNINFAKHWQQFNILDSMRRFRTSNYRMARNERILAMFNDFEDYMQEEPLWQLSQKIKPRGSGGAASGAGGGTGLNTGTGHKKQNSVS